MCHPQHPHSAYHTEIAPQQVVAISRCNRFEINITSWCEGDLRQNGIEIARVEQAANRTGVFLELMKIVDMHIDAELAERHLPHGCIDRTLKTRPPLSQQEEKLSSSPKLESANKRTAASG